jgi:hypothetical protein
VTRTESGSGDFFNDPQIHFYEVREKFHKDVDHLPLATKASRIKALGRVFELVADLGGEGNAAPLRGARNRIASGLPPAH